MTQLPGRPHSIRTASLLAARPSPSQSTGARDLAGNLMVPVAWSFTTAAPGFQDVALSQTGLEEPTVLQFASDGRIFVSEKSGRIKVYDSIADATPTVVVDLRINVHNFWDRGMLGMVLHPNFPTVPYIYVLYAFDAVLPAIPAPRWGGTTTTADDCPANPGATTNGCVITGRLSRLELEQLLGNAARSSQRTGPGRRLVAAVSKPFAGQPRIRRRWCSLCERRRRREFQLCRLRAALRSGRQPALWRSLE